MGSEAASGDGAGVRARLVTLYVLGALWVVDGLLQLQPAMFTSAFADNVIGAAIQSLPAPLYRASLQVFIDYVVPHIAAWNAFFAALQISLGVLIIRGRSRVRRYALEASIAWSAFLWVFGEGMGGILASTMQGGVFPGTPSLLSGFPGAALLYLWLSVILLAPEKWWRLRGVFSPVRDFPALLFALAAAVQAAPLMWTSYGQSSIFTANLDNLPGYLSATVTPIASFAVAHPVESNLAEVTVIGGVAVFLWAFKPRRWGYMLAAAVLGFAWWFGMGVGGTLTGLGTDPNTPPLIFAAIIPFIYFTREVRSAQPSLGELVSEIPKQRRRSP